MSSALIRPSAQAAEASVSGDIETLEVDVAVVGTGPSRLTAALALAKRQVRVAIVDPCLEPNSASPRCKQWNPRTMEHFRRLQVSELVRSSAPLPRGWSDSRLSRLGEDPSMSGVVVVRTPVAADDR